MPNVRVKDKETALDIAVLVSGDIAGMFELSLLNNISLTKNLVSGDELIPCAVIDEEAVSELKSRRARPASSVDMNEGDKLEGIGYWQIGNDFIVQ